MRAMHLKRDLAWHVVKHSEWAVIIKNKFHPVWEESGVRFRRNWQGTASLVAFLNRLPALTAPAQVTVC